MTNGFCDLERLEVAKGIREPTLGRVVKYFHGFWLCAGHARMAIVEQLEQAKFPRSSPPIHTSISFTGAHIHIVEKGRCINCGMSRVEIMQKEFPDEPEDEDIREPRYNKEDLD